MSFTNGETQGKRRLKEVRRRVEEGGQTDKRVVTDCTCLLEEKGFTEEDFYAVVDAVCCLGILNTSPLCRTVAGNGCGSRIMREALTMKFAWKAKMVR